MTATAAASTNPVVSCIGTARGTKSWRKPTARATPRPNTSSSAASGSPCCPLAGARSITSRIFWAARGSLRSRTAWSAMTAISHPSGGELPYTNSCPAQNNYKFEGKERDTETSNDDFGARSYSWRFGRWLSADWSAFPVPVPYANLTNPQTLNLYALVADDPESFADLDGHDLDPNCGPTNCKEDPGNKNANETQANAAAAEPKTAEKQQAAAEPTRLTTGERLKQLG